MLDAIISTIAVLFIVATIMDGVLPKKYYLMSIVLITAVQCIVDTWCVPISYTCRLIVNLLLLARFVRPKTAIIVASVSECFVGIIVVITGLLLNSILSHGLLLPYQPFLYPAVLTAAVTAIWLKYRKKTRKFIDKLERKSLITISLVSLSMIPVSFHQVTAANLQMLLMALFMYICLVFAVSFLLTYYIKELVAEESEHKQLVYEKSAANVSSLLTINHNLLSVLRTYIDDKDAAAEDFRRYCFPTHDSRWNIAGLERLSDMSMVKGLLYGTCTSLDNDYQVNLYIDDSFHIDKETIDEKDLYLVLSIFIDNAIKYSQGQKVIQITMMNIGSNSLISIENTSTICADSLCDYDKANHSLTNAKKILSSYKEIDYLTFNNNDFIVQRLILKQQRKGA